MKQYNVLVIGSGGTGGYFLKEVSRYIAYLSKEKKSMIKALSIADGDILETKNLSRQSFSSLDVGRYKASAFADMLNEALFMDIKGSVFWKAFTKYIITMEDLEEIIISPDESVDEVIPVIIGCVDNHACRMLCEEFFHKVSSCIYFDSANEFSSGQVVFSYKWKGVVYSPCRSFYFPGIEHDDLRPVTEIPCTELNNVEPQHIVTNMLAGNHLLAAFCRLIESNDMFQGMTQFDAHSMQSEFCSYHSSFQKRISAICGDVEMEELRLLSMDERFFSNDECKALKANPVQEKLAAILGQLSEIQEMIPTVAKDSLDSFA